MGLMNRITTYVRQKDECSLGEIEIQLDIPIWRQYVLARAYGDFFDDVKLIKSRWRLVTMKEPTIVPVVSQECLKGGNY
jgi:hypothetical protein